jgi:hypothetical protein
MAAPCLHGGAGGGWGGNGENVDRHTGGDDRRITLGGWKQTVDGFLTRCYVCGVDATATLGRKVTVLFSRSTEVTL